MPDPEKGHSFGACLTFFRVRNLFADPHGRRAKRSLTVIDLNPFRIRKHISTSSSYRPLHFRRYFYRVLPFPVNKIRTKMR